jgi:hypothetical protein
MVATSAVVKVLTVSQAGRINRRACDSLRDSDGLRLQHFPHGGRPNECGTDLSDACRPLGVYAGRILRGVRALGITVSPSLLARADEVTE